jgi:DNA-directed RNA polymerase subunit RPC12/RpoP
MFFKRKSKNNCEHDWHELETAMETEFLPYGFMESEKHENSYIYCPKCNSRNKVRSDEWKRIEKAQEIKKEYNRKNVNGGI